MGLDLNDLELQFLSRGYTWRRNGQDFTPTVDDLEDFLQKAKEKIDEKPDDEVWYIAGRMIVYKRDGHYDVYLYQGELDDQPSRDSD